MEEMFLNIITAINDSRYWLGPLLVVCVSVMAIVEIIGVMQD